LRKAPHPSARNFRLSRGWPGDIEQRRGPAGNTRRVTSCLNFRATGNGRRGRGVNRPPCGFRPTSIVREVAEPLCTRAHSGHCRVLVWKLISSAGYGISSNARGSLPYTSKIPRKTDFYADKQKQDAVIRHIEIIGEAAAHVSAATRQAVPELAFRKMRGMRNIVAHDYSNVDLKIVWEVATVYVPKFAPPWKSFLTVRIEPLTLAG
jgi:uncharacterized protein with HEPN domain